MIATKFESALLRERYWKIEHPSGLRIYVFPKRTTVAYAVLATAYGSLDVSFRTADRPDFVTVPDGVAHFLEHKLFDNPDGSDSLLRFTALGADANAYTDYNRTAYLFSTAERFGESLEELLRFVFTPYFTPETVAKERGIIAEEIRMYRDAPFDRCFQNLLEGLYHSHPVRRNICGSEGSIANITADLLYECYRVFYQPSNMILCVSGDVAPETVTAAADRILPASPAPRAIIRAPICEPETAARSEISARMPVSKPIFYLAVKDPVLPPDAMARLRRDAAMSLLSDVLFSRSSVFFNRLFERGLLTTSYSHGYSGTDSFAFHSICGESNDPRAVRRECAEYLAQVRENGISEDDFRRSKRGLIADQIRAYDSTEEICNNLLSFALEGLDLFSYPDLLSSVTKEECESLLNEVFTPERECLSVVEDY